MKTADEIKKGLECCNEICDIESCPYWEESECNINARNDALALIQQLQDENAEKDAKIQQLESDKQQLEGMLAHMNQLCDAAAGRALSMEERVHQLEAERDAAVKDLSECTASHCPYCKHWDKPGRAVVCINCRNGAPRCKQHFEWRGVQKEDGNGKA